jgi:hypothetical protein
LMRAAGAAAGLPAELVGSSSSSLLRQPIGMQDQQRAAAGLEA